MYTLDNVATAPSYTALKRNNFTDEDVIAYYLTNDPLTRKMLFMTIKNGSIETTPKRQMCSNSLTAKPKTQMCTVDIDSVRDMALDYIDRTWTYRGRDFKLTDMGWRFQFNEKKRANGVCSPRNRTLYLSTYVLEHSTREMSGWINTMIHEIAHAINHHLGGRGHDARWRDIFITLGGTGDRCSKDVTWDNLLEKPVSKYTLVCPNGHTSPSHKVSRTVQQGRRSCGKCSNVFDRRYLLKQVQNW
jgi:predicted SprT family Zn-dependent metalloprotease